MTYLRMTVFISMLFPGFCIAGEFCAIGQTGDIGPCWSVQSTCLKYAQTYDRSCIFRSGTESQSGQTNGSIGSSFRDGYQTGEAIGGLLREIFNKKSREEQASLQSQDPFYGIPMEARINAMNEQMVAQTCAKTLDLAKSWAGDSADYSRRIREWLKNVDEVAKQKNDPGIMTEAISYTAKRVEAYKQENKDNLYQYRRETEKVLEEHYAKNPNTDDGTGGISSISMRNIVERDLRTQELLLSYAAEIGFNNPDASELRIERLLVEQCDAIKAALR